MSRIVDCSDAKYFVCADIDPRTGRLYCPFDGGLWTDFVIGIQNWKRKYAGNDGLMLLCEAASYA